MDLRTAAQSVRRAFDKGTKRFRNLETGIAAFCAFSPLLMIFFDSCRYTNKAAACFTRITDQRLDYEEDIRGAISHYWDMPAPVAFYVPLTVAVMIFVVRGAVRANSKYNWILGSGLLMLVVFNHDQFTVLHFAGVFVFFFGNVIVVGLAIARNFLNVGVLLGAAFFFFVVGNVVDSNWSGNWVLWLQWASLLVIAAHFILVAWNPGGYKDFRLSPAKRRELRAEVSVEDDIERRTATEARPTARQEFPTAKVPGGGLPVRAVPNRNADPTGRIKGGSVVRLIERSGIWVKIESDEGSPGWVEGRRVGTNRRRVRA